MSLMVAAQSGDFRLSSRKSRKSRHSAINKSGTAPKLPRGSAFAAVARLSRIVCAPLASQSRMRLIRLWRGGMAPELYIPNMVRRIS